MSDERDQLIEDNAALQKQVDDITKIIEDNDILFDYEPLEATLPCNTAYKTVSIGTNYKCGYKATDQTLLYYPTDGAVSRDYPVVFFHPGSSGYQDWESGPDGKTGYLEWARKIAGQCVVVVMPQTYTTSGSGFQDEDLCKRDYDLKIAYDWASSASVYSYKLELEIGKIVNWDRIALMGHSAGGHHIPKALSYWTFRHPFTDVSNVKAIVFSHSGKDLPLPANPTDSWSGYWPGDHGIPTMMVTSAKDCTVYNKDVLAWYETNKAKGVAQSNAYHTVFASTGGSHMEPVKTGYFSTWMGRFLACHLFASGDERKAATCKHFYGDSADICSAKHLSVTPSTPCRYEDGSIVPGISKPCDQHGSALA